MQHVMHRFKYDRTCCVATATGGFLPLHDPDHLRRSSMSVLGFALPLERRSGESPSTATKEDSASTRGAGTETIACDNPGVRGALAPFSKTVGFPSTRAFGREQQVRRTREETKQQAVSTTNNPVMITAAAGINTSNPGQINEDLITTVAAALHEADYCSGGAYTSTLRRTRTINYEVQGPAMTWPFKKIDEALAIGMGPPDKAPEILLKTMRHDAELYNASPTLGGPDHYSARPVVLPREIESSAVITCPEQLRVKDDGDVGLMLPMSKTDTKLLWPNGQMIGSQ